MYRNPCYLILLVAYAVTACAQPSTNTDEQIAIAVLAAPEEHREGATVYGYNADGELALLREGTNHLICTADDPSNEGFSVACYHRDLQPFMERGRELRAEGKNRQEVFDTREAEAKSGELAMPDQPTTLHLFEGQEATYDAETGTVVGAKYRYVVYIPFATAASTGLPIGPVVPGGPWIMDPGTHRAHIMITPPVVPEEEEEEQ